MEWIVHVENRQKGWTAIRRTVLAGAAVLTIALGLSMHYAGSGAMAGFASDALYTVMLYLVLGIIAPRTARRNLALVAFGISALVELAQLSDIPATLAQAFPPAALLFGTTFSLGDVAAYAAGALLAFAMDGAVRAVSAGSIDTQPHRGV